VRSARHELPVASLRRRVAATAIDGVLGITTYFGGFALGLEALEQICVTVDTRELFQSSAYRRAHNVGLPVVRVALRNVPTMGQRLMGIRRVNARTGGPISLPRALVRMLLAIAYGRAIHRLLAPVRERQEARAAQNVGPLSCWVTGLIPILIEVAPEFFTRSRQPLSDWVTGIVVVRD
jgi:RDD family